MANTIYNAARGADFFTTAGVGTASGELTSVKVLGGAAMKIANTSKLDGVTLGKAAANPTTSNISYRGFKNGVGSTFKGAEINAKSFSNSGGYLAFTGIALADNLAVNALAVGAWVNMHPGLNAVLPREAKNILYGAQQITAINTTTGIFVTNMPYSAALSGTTLYLNAHARNFNTQVAGQYIVQKLGNKIAGTASNTLLGAGNAGQLTRSINKLEAIRTTKTLTALRAGYYNRYTGKWTTAATMASTSDLATVIWANGTAGDDAATPSRTAPGGITFKGGALKPVSSTGYAARTTW